VVAKRNVRVDDLNETAGCERTVEKAEHVNPDGRIDSPPATVIHRRRCEEDGVTQDDVVRAVTQDVLVARVEHRGGGTRQCTCSLQVPPVHIAPEETRARKQRTDRDELLSGGAAERENGQALVGGNGTAKHGVLRPVATEERPVVALQLAIY
jgi:hypothetical protein